MSVGFLRAVAEGCRRYGVSVTLEAGCETRGNGQAFPNGRPAGLLLHHTGGDYGAGLSILLNGRSDLPPPLCNSCGYPDGRIHLIAAHPANHAGASGGRNMGPLPVSRLFNKIVWGHEIMYPGSKPWTPDQEHSAIVLGAVISLLLARPNGDWVRAHAETSITGKWDIGAGAAGRTVDMSTVRNAITTLMRSGPAAPQVSAVHYEEGDDVHNYVIKEPGGLPLRGRIVLGCPTNDLAESKRRAWVSAIALDLRDRAWVEVFAQGTAGGTGQWRWDEKQLGARADNFLPRAVTAVPPNTSHLVISWDLSKAPEGGTLLLETRPIV